MPLFNLHFSNCDFGSFHILASCLGFLIYLYVPFGLSCIFLINFLEFFEHSSSALSNKVDTSHV